MQWVTCALGEDCNSFWGEACNDDWAVEQFKSLTGATKVTRLRITVEYTYRAYLYKDGEPMGYFCLYLEEN